MKRILLNAMASYGRSLYALVVGLLCSRWVLLSLGEVDFGLFGVVGGLIAICVTFNAILASATTRFFAVAIGESARLGAEEGTENCRRWFNVAVLAHVTLATVLVAVGYPIGAWAIGNWLTIPSDRLADCLWVFRFSCLTAFVSMVNVPFSGMFIAKQEIAEQSLYSSLQTTFGFLITGYMVLHPGKWLVGYAALISVNTMLPEVVICVRALFKYRECRLKFAQMNDWPRMWQMVRFALCQSFVSVGYIFLSQGMNILVNKTFGPAMNAAMGVATKVQTQAATLSSALATAFQPAVASAWGAGDLAAMRTLSMRATRFGVFCALVFAVPLLVGIDQMLVLWLKTPPSHTNTLCSCLLVASVVDRLGLGQDMAICASGRIGRYQLCQGISWMMSVPAATAFLACGCGVGSIGLGIITGYALSAATRIAFARAILGFPILDFVVNQAGRALVAGTVAVLSGLALAQYCGGAFATLGAMALAAALFVAVFWVWVVSAEERAFVVARGGELVRRKLRGEGRRG